jgi:ribokinase
LKTPKIVVVGSYATGLTMKVSCLPNAGETMLGSGYRVDFGGKGSNQAVACARLGTHVSFVAKIGQDSFGDAALQLYRDEGVDTAHVKRIAEAPTGVGFIIVEAAQGQNCIAIDPGANEFLAASDVAGAAEVFQSSAAVLTQLEVPVAAAEEAMAQGRAQGAVTILNPAPVRPLPASVLQLVDIITPNETEARVLSGKVSGAHLDAEAVARDLVRSGVRQVVMTLGKNGALIVTASDAIHVPGVEVAAVDSTGAGDAFNAGLATALAHGASVEAATHFAVVTGGLSVTKEGVIPSLPRREEIAQFYREHSRKLPEWWTTR